MSEETTTAEAGEQTEPQFDPITSQEALDKIVQARVARERNKFADYDELKEKAAKFAELEDASKSEAQKAIERAEAAERALEEQRAEAARLRVIAEHGIPAEFQNLISGTGEEMEAAAKQVAQLISKTSGPVVATEGRQPSAPTDSGDWLREQLRKK